VNRVRYDSESMKLITLFESMTGAKIKDCISNERLVFIVEENDMGKAIGKSGANIKRIENALKRKVKLVEFSNDVLQFVRNMIHPIEALEVKNEGNIITIRGKDTGTKAMLIGRERQNLSHLSDIVKRHFDIEEIKVA